MREAGATAVVLKREALDEAERVAKSGANKGIRGWGEPGQLLIADVKAYASGDD